ncbi:MAG: hypothetical protein FWE48_00255 [Coriobacteriia bacterium]|nr:hypothetical protein [Coriobacteriia bacterium]MCL2745518.1 hypothetical protein [Coriobacteriia bacterium]MCL2871176.1 hypothetical protein [Coriobacteriia bacterium]
MTAKNKIFANCKKRLPILVLMLATFVLTMPLFAAADPVIPPVAEQITIGPLNANGAIPHDATYITATFFTPQIPGSLWVRIAGTEMSSFEWSEGNTVAKITIPAGLLPTTGSVAAEFQNFRITNPSTGGIGQSAMNVVFVVGDPDPDPALFTKTLRAPEGTTLPTATFAFEFSRVQVSLSTTPPIQSRPITEVPVISPNPTITVDPSTATTATVAGVVTATESLDLWDLLDNLTFSGGGVYVWEVSEVANSSGTTPPSFMTYDTSRFQVRAHVNRYNDLAVIEIFELDSSGNLGDKIEAIDFINTYRRDVGGTLENNALEVTKNVVGEFANLSTLFDFTLTLAPHTLAPITFPFTATVVDSAGDPIAGPRGTVSVTGNTTTFQLQHGERFVIPTLPAGTTFSVSEAAHTEFAPSVSVVVGGTVAHTDSAAPNNPLATGNHILTDAGRNAADYTNTHQFAPPTGFALSNLLFVLPVLALIGLLLALTSRRRKALEQMPIEMG